MIYPSADKIEKQVESKYALVILAAKRAKQLKEGGRPRIPTDSRNPLVSRVVVNHYWQLLFGKGLVSTAEDFGSQGSLPTHPELLDWLAFDFMASGWDLKKLMKKIVLSAT